MKRDRVLITIFFVLFIGVGWIAQICGSLKQGQKYSNYVTEADNLRNDGLYQKAIEAYRSALGIKNDEKVYEKMLEAYKLSYLEGSSTKKEYANALLEICNSNPRTPHYWELLIQLHVDTGDYSSAYSAVKKSMNAGAKSDALSELTKDVLYSFSIGKKSFSEVYRAPNGCYTMYDGTKWGVMDSKGEWIYECEYDYAGPISSDRNILLSTTNGNRIVDKKGIPQYLIAFECEKSNAYSEGYLPVLNNGEKWQFYSCENNEFVFDEYEYVSSFANGLAVVKKEDQWNFINSVGEKMGDIVFDDVKLYGNGEYTYSDVMIASQDEKYYIFDANGNKKSDHGFNDADIYLGEYIAFMDESGKWGFADKKGKEVIKPQFEGAKSFSNGLAAVFNGQCWGYIDTNGEVVIDYQFESADYFTNDGVCFVSAYENAFHMIKLRFN